MSRTKEDLIACRIQRAYHTLEEAKTLAVVGHWNAVANRLYYACFYAVLALLAKNDMDTYTHFIKSGLVNIVWGKLYQKLFDNRNEADYEDFIDFDEETIGVFVDESKQFIDIISSLAKQ